MCETLILCLYFIIICLPTIRRITEGHAKQPLPRFRDGEDCFTELEVVR